MWLPKMKALGFALVFEWKDKTWVLSRMLILLGLVGRLVHLVMMVGRVLLGQLNHGLELFMIKMLIY